MPQNVTLSVVRSFLETQLSRSGIRLDEIANKAFIALSASETCTLLGHKRDPWQSIYIPYFNPDGTPLLQNGSRMFRIRLDIPDLKDKTAAALGTKSKKGRAKQKYKNPPGASPAPYFSPNVDWPPILADATKPLIIVEGEKKAYKLCQEGFHAIGIGGVWNWKSKKKGIFWLPELAQEHINWVGRRVDICFDSDISTKPGVGHALISLAEALGRLDANVYQIELPSIEGETTGADDFLVQRPNAAFTELRNAALPISYYWEVYALRQQFGIVKSISRIVNLDTFELIRKSDFTSLNEADKLFHEPTVGSDGKVGKVKIVSAAEKFIKHPFTTRFHSLSYLPGGERIIESPDYPGMGLIDLNVWPGLAVEPVEGDCQPAIDLINHLMTGAEPEAVRWFYQWLAYPLARLGTKTASAVLLHSAMQGQGKTLVHETMAGIYGRNAAIATQDSLESQFNFNLVNRQWITCDEINGADRNNVINKLKPIITSERRTVQRKGVDTYEIQDYSNLFFTSNHANALGIDEFDRRFFIHEVVVGKLPPEFYVNYHAWLESPGGLSAWLYHLQNKIDLTGFHPKAEAFMTESKHNMVQANRTMPDQFLKDLMSAPDRFTLNIHKDLYTFDEVSLMSAAPDGRIQFTAKMLSHSAGKMSLPRITNAGGMPRQVELTGGLKRYLLIVRNEAQDWSSRYFKDSEVNKYLNSLPVGQRSADQRGAKF